MFSAHERQLDETGFITTDHDCIVQNQLFTPGGDENYGLQEPVPVIKLQSLPVPSGVSKNRGVQIGLGLVFIISVVALILALIVGVNNNPDCNGVDSPTTCSDLLQQNVSALHARVEERETLEYEQAALIQSLMITVTEQSLLIQSLNDTNIKTNIEQETRMQLINEKLERLLENSATMRTTSSTSRTSTSFPTSVSPLEIIVEDLVKNVSALIDFDKLNTVYGFYGAQMDDMFIASGIADVYMVGVGACALVKTVTGKFQIQQSNLQGALTISGFNSLATVGNSFKIVNNDLLTDISGFINLTAVDGEFQISGNTALNDISGFTNLIAVGDAVEIYSNHALTDISGLTKLTTIGRITISTHSALTDISGFTNLITVDQSVTIMSNYALIKISGFTNLTTVGGGGFQISYNAALTYISGFTKLISVTGQLRIVSNSALTDISGFTDLTTARDVSITLNPALTDISGFNSLTKLDRGFTISSNAALTDISGFTNLTTIVGILRIEKNSKLTNFEGLQNVNCVRGGIYSDNPATYCQNCPQWLIDIATQTKGKC